MHIAHNKNKINVEYKKKIVEGKEIKENRMMREMCAEIHFIYVNKS